MMRLLLVALASILVLACTRTAPRDVAVNWVSFEEAVRLQQENPKPILVAIVVKWCGVCKKMKTSTFTNPVVANYVNEHFYAVQFDAEQKESIQFKGKTFEYVDRGGSRGTHELGLELTNGELTYPITTFLDENLEVIKPTSGYVDAAGMERLVKFISTKAYAQTDWESFIQDDAQFELPATENPTWKQ